MGLIDIDALAAPIDADNPAGENLEYDPQFEALKNAAQTKEATQFGGESEPPDWRQTQGIAIELLGRSNSLEIAVFLIRAAVAMQGVKELGAGLGLIERMLTDDWDGVHPRLVDEDGDEDIYLRINALGALEDRGGFLRDLRNATLVAARGVGTFTVRQFEVASGLSDPREGETPSAIEHINGAFSEIEEEERTAILDSLTESARAAQAIQDFANQQFNDMTAVQLPDLAGLVTRLASHFTDLAAGEVPAELEADEEVAGDGSGPVAGGKAKGTGIAGVSGRADVKRLIDLICEYYAKAEPASPVPILLRRAQRMVDKNFMEIIKDLMPDSVAQVETYVGPDESEDDGY